MQNTTGEPIAERVVARLRRHGRVLILPVVVLLASVGAVSYLYGTFREQWISTLVLVGGVAVIVLLVLLPYLMWLNHRYTLTTRRVIVRQGFFVRTRQEVLHSRGYTVTVKRGPLQALFRSGDIVITSGVDKPILLKDIPGANQVQAVLHDLIERAQGQIGYGAYAAGSASRDETSML
ncbi:membrane protein YdbS, contains bPH2 (pleckstrin homology) domain [Paramicrobacterium humi]|uniref:Membrane protein YdbS, contains bPH2 (Pleckstrin homology) domain n=1 Tax=Paramicrobacterium humi TaxID=640635 RepID=A0A1H4ISU4_9MICO|nr:PH domain-containing protein [Microbacterium humi]SEB37164.1 membrane protein YdbS, contains bPH2 (pleckstrin homology) domain [Microbacterium humi]